MADTKITALAAIATVDPAADVLPIVDISDTSMAASGTTKKVTSNQILGAGGTATLASATITGAATVGTTLGVTGVTTLTGNVGVGVTPSAWSTYKGLQVGYASLAGYAGTDTFLGSNVYFDGGAFRYIAAGLASSYRQLAGSHEWKTAVAGVNPGDAVTLVTQATLDASGNLSPVGNVVMANTKGIDFSATAGTGTSELLNDYEEGTWVGTLTGDTTNPTTTQQATGRYTKIGRVVTVQISFVNVDTTGASGLVKITGLPFSNNASVSSVGSVTSYNLSTFTGSPFAFVGTGESFLTLYANVSGTAYSDVNHSAGTARYSTASITYTVA